MAYLSVSRLSLACVLIVGIPINTSAQERLSWQASELARQELEGVAKARWAQENESVRRSGTIKWTNDPRVRCTAIPMYPAPDRSSNSSKPFAWHIDFIEGGTVKDDRARQLKQLDALVKAGVLQKMATEVEINGSRVKAIQYGLSLAGWKVSTTDHSPFCFMYGTLRLQGVKVNGPVTVSGQAGIEMYDVSSRVGLQENEMEEWARSEEVRAVFPDVRQLLQGEERRRQFVREGNGWIPYECLQLRKMRKKLVQMCEVQGKVDYSKDTLVSGSGQQSEELPLQMERFVQQLETELPKELEKRSPSEREKLRQEVLQRINDLKNLPAPTEEEVKNLIQNMHEGEGGNTDFVALKLYFDKEYRFRYRALLSLKLPPGRILDQDILTYRKDLKLMLEHGKACAGDYGFDIKSRGSYGGGGSCWHAVDSDTQSQRAYSNDNNTSLAGPLALEDAVARGVLRKATNADAEAWVQAVMRSNPKRNELPETRSHAYVVLKEFIYPAGLYGGDSASFFIPKGVPMPIGIHGHSVVYDFNTLQCHGYMCGR